MKDTVKKSEVIYIFNSILPNFRLNMCRNFYLKLMINDMRKHPQHVSSINQGSHSSSLTKFQTNSQPFPYSIVQNFIDDSRGYEIKIQMAIRVKSIQLPLIKSNTTLVLRADIFKWICPEWQFVKPKIEIVKLDCDKLRLTICIICPTFKE